jgi:hypothetical protein
MFVSPYGCLKWGKMPLDGRSHREMGSELTSRLQPASAQAGPPTQSEKVWKARRALALSFQFQPGTQTWGQKFSGSPNNGN